MTRWATADHHAEAIGLLTPPGEHEPGRGGAHQLRRLLPWILSAVLLVIAARSVTDVRDGLHLLGRTSPRWVLLAVLWEVLAYIVLSSHLRLLAGSPDQARRLAPVRTALVVFGLGSIMPVAPAEGIVMASAAHRRRGADPTRSVLALALSQWFSLAGVTIVTAAVAVAVALDDPTFPASKLVGSAGAASLLAVVAFTWLSWRPATAEWAARAVGRVRHPWRYAPAQERREQGRRWREAAGAVIAGPGHAFALLATMVGGWFCSAMCFAVALRGVGEHTGVSLALLAFALGVQATALPFLPAGAGVLEAIASSILALGKVPVPAALAAVVIYRLVGTLLPALAGLVALASLRWSPDSRGLDRPEEPEFAGSGPTPCRSGNP